MGAFRSAAVGVIIAAAFAVAACGGEPPERELQLAQGAIDAARAAGAETYARDEFSAAEDALKRAQDAVAARDYRLALNHALDSHERAQNAATQAADGKAAARVTAERALSEASDSLAALEARLKTAHGARRPARALSGARQALADGERLVQEARTALERGDYMAASTSATSATASLADAMRDVAAVGSPPARGRR